VGRPTLPGGPTRTAREAASSRRVFATKRFSCGHHTWGFWKANLRKGADSPAGQGPRHYGVTRDDRGASASSGSTSALQGSGIAASRPARSNGSLKRFVNRGETQLARAMSSRDPLNLQLIVKHRCRALDFSGLMYTRVVREIQNCNPGQGVFLAVPNRRRDLQSRLRAFQSGRGQEGAA